MALSVSEKPEVENQPHETCTKVVEQFSTPVSILDILMNKKNILQQCTSIQPGRKKRYSLGKNGHYMKTVYVKTVC
jgi:hypothetical protein